MLFGVITAEAMNMFDTRKFRECLGCDLKNAEILRSGNIVHKASPNIHFREEVYAKLVVNLTFREATWYIKSEEWSECKMVGSVSLPSYFDGR